jgi:hypothetical protein
MLQGLRLALRASHGNLDLYQPSDEFLTVLATGPA